MPLYDYQCTGCGKRIEVLQRFSDAPLRECPHCGGELHKLPSAPALHFKGSGFYLTDYGRAGGGKADNAGAKSEGSKDAAPAADAKPATDTKPAPSPSTDKKAS
jgi:putative FmdB family regulatory protein